MEGGQYQGNEYQRINLTRQAEAEQEPTLRLRFRPGTAPQQTTQATHRAIQRALPEVGDLHPVAQQVIAVKLDERVEVKERVDAADRQHDEGQVVDQRIRHGQPPDEDGQGPQK